MAQVRAKFKVVKIERTMGSRTKLDPQGNAIKNERGYDEQEPCELHTIHLQPVYGNGDPNHENTRFWRASPSGKIELTCVDAHAVAALHLDKEYYVDLTLAK